jgi:hypothetical protein
MNPERQMPSHKDYLVQGVRYTNAHLQTFMTKATAKFMNKSESQVAVQVSFSTHCYCRSPDDGESILDDGLVFDGRVNRIFSPERHAMSFHLQPLIDELLSGGAQLQFTDRDNLVKRKDGIQVTLAGGLQIGPHPYFMFFSLKKVKPVQDGLRPGEEQGRHIKLYVESGHANSKNYSPRWAKVNSAVLFGSCWEGRDIKKS